jgi:hypothetical protein
MVPQKRDLIQPKHTVSGRKPAECDAAPLFIYCKFNKIFFFFKKKSGLLCLIGCLLYFIHATLALQRNGA